LISLLEVNATLLAVPKPKSGGATAGSTFDSERATLSHAASEVSQTVIGECVRWEKVAAIRAAQADGTYSVPAAALAAKLVESMLSGGHSPSARADKSTNKKHR
jgi:anti-sigma28 factor (negative regulator of flagellin synthesis)